MRHSSQDILARLNAYHSVNVDLSLRDSYAQLLGALGNPQLKLPPIIHVAGTNGKGSTIAFLRAMLEASGLKVHVYTSPHLVSFHERIRLAGQLISEDDLCDVLLECERLNDGAPVTQFEITTAAAFLAFSRVTADVLLLEVGLGGRLDATNMISQPLASVITRISYDHRDFLGNSLHEIASEKAGIFRKNIPAIIAPQFAQEVTQTLIEKAAATQTPLHAYGTDWSYTPNSTGLEFVVNGKATQFPKPNLIGMHQYANAATAIAVLKQQTKFNIDDAAIAHGVQHAEWPARLQQLKNGPLVDLLPQGYELWLDGGHNDSAGDMLAIQAASWAAQDKKPLMVILGMLASKHPEEFLASLASHISALAAIPIPNEKTQSADTLALTARETGIKITQNHQNAQDALKWLISLSPQPARILITGSLYLAGQILQKNK
ncbi:MAG: folylpolyglutamate synthase/dihydrofolate synthase family protein [Alphaproteobacteria bacterium]|nr:folylpolyglutamate synthase/dihydrofolate synthase family protein [Alphaproteobacteria bacterium]